MQEHGDEHDMSARKRPRLGRVAMARKGKQQQLVSISITIERGMLDWKEARYPDMTTSEFVRGMWRREMEVGGGIAAMEGRLAELRARECPKRAKAADQLRAEIAYLEKTIAAARAGKEGAERGGAKEAAESAAKQQREKAEQARAAKKAADEREMQGLYDEYNRANAAGEDGRAREAMREIARRLAEL